MSDSPSVLGCELDAAETKNKIKEKKPPPPPSSVTGSFVLGSERLGKMTYSTYLSAQLPKEVGMKRGAWNRVPAAMV